MVLTGGTPCVVEEVSGGQVSIKTIKYSRLIWVL